MGSWSAAAASVQAASNATSAFPEASTAGFLLYTPSTEPEFINNIVITMDQCLQDIRNAGVDPYPPQDDGLWCNATWDTVLCWPPTRANTSVWQQCPPLKGLDPTKSISKWCNASGRWEGKNDTDVQREHGWTNFSMCYTEEVIYIMKHLTNGSLSIAQDVARNARKMEFVGLGLSLVSLVVSICIFSYFRRLRVFRNLLHLQLMIAILMVVIIRLILYIDLIFTDRLGHQQTPGEGKTINTMVFVCEAMFFLLEYFKTAAFGWMFLEGFYLYNQLVLTVFNAEPKLSTYILAGYGIPLIHTCVWLMALLYKKEFKVERCLGSYYLEPEFWILDGPRMAELVINAFFILKVIIVLWSKVQHTGNVSELLRMKKSVKAALMLIPLLGIPNIMQTIPFSPTKDNITMFAIWTYCASFTYMYQGLMIAIIYCFTNKEVKQVVRACYARYRLQHTGATDLRRGSRSITTHYTAKNGSVTTALARNGSTQLSPSAARIKRGSDESSTDDGTMNNNGSCITNLYGPTELTPLNGMKKTGSDNNLTGVQLRTLMGPDLF